ncbi:hypothetical protein NP493_42g06012 [Ridgeia piscesae]|uniref:Secreted protein n=1 Tax=Ridgeia piscesae TaxID=27915 RepID=A0AAD9UJW0_RIDPI|nr:hypothetical protein NP493_42g06012 [Ridgeia piscesae]
MIGTTVLALSLIKLTMYSLFQKYSALSATWKCGLDTHLASCLNSGTITLLNSAGSMTSRISSSSFRNITSFGLCTFGQYFNSANVTGSVRLGSFSRNWTTQYASCGW